MLRASSVSVSFGATPILREVSLNIEKEDFVSIVGPNGAGKTTLIRCLLGLLQFDGEVRLKDENIRSCSRKKIARSIGYVPQVVGMLPGFTVEQFVGVGRFAHRSGVFAVRSGERLVIEQAMESTNVEHLRKRELSKLSGGERQRVLLAAALAQEPEMILLDEPASHLDPKHEVELYRLLRTLHQEQGKGVCMVSHNLNSAAAISKRIIALKAGELVFDGASQQFMKSETLEHLYDTSFSVLENPENGENIALAKFSRNDV